MSDGRLIPAPPRGHHCALPWDRVGYGSTGQRDGTVFVCGKCEQAWFSAPCYQTFGPTSHWRRVRWWHFRLRSRIKGTSDVPGEAPVSPRDG